MHDLEQIGWLVLTQGFNQRIQIHCNLIINLKPLLQSISANRLIHYQQQIHQLVYGVLGADLEFSLRTWSGFVEHLQVLIAQGLIAYLVQ